ncbi:MAG: tRNA threonylcarbamoyladenosine dehydratase [Clostridia bacterium]|nr:tRNA threonylcarbamoyladenosine dehydratase [Clostridia bacterium]
MDERFERSALLLGVGGIDRLRKSTVAIFGVGGVGSYVAEALARVGVGHVWLVDHDVVSLSNVNRQIEALENTVGQPKTQAMKQRMLQINPAMQVTEWQTFYLPENAEEFPLQETNYVVDAMDTVTAKLELAQRCFRMGIPQISSMGAGNKLDPTKFEVTDIYQTKICPLAKVMRRELRRRGVERLKVVYSTEEAKIPRTQESVPPGQKILGSVPFVPSVAGLIAAGEVVRDLIG